jgi:hypothetical protein
MTACRIYGVGLAVDVPIAGLRGTKVADRIDVSMSLASLSKDVSDALAGPCEEFYASDDKGVRVAKLGEGAYYRIAYDDGTRIVVDAPGEHIWATTPDGATVEDTATYLLGPGLGFTLRLRGITCLHASAVVIDGAAVAFMGPAGAGKSTLAACFAVRGHAVLTDDVAALVVRGDSFAVEPAYPRIRLWPDSVAALFGDAQALPRITPTWEKRFLDLNDPRYRFQAEPLPLAAIYLLRPGGGAPACAPVAPRAALMSLVAETYTTRFMRGALRANEFEVLARVVENVPLRELSTPRDLHQGAEACERIVADLRR